MSFLGRYSYTNLYTYIIYAIYRKKEGLVLTLPLQLLILQLQHHIRLFGQLFTVGDNDDAFVVFVGGPAQDVDDVGGGGFVQVTS